MIRFTNLSFRYGDSSEYSLKNIDVKIDDGEFLLVSGPSGGGKSSFCRCVNGLIPHFYGGYISGDAVIDGNSILENTPRDFASTIGMTFQDPENQLTSTDVEREIVFGMENLGFSPRLMSKRLEEALDSIGIAHLRHRNIHELSGGEKQKVAIASVLALHPRVLIMDEPTSELDPKGAEEVLSVVQRLNDELGLTVILVEHRLERVIHLIDRVVLLHEGKIIADGTPRTVFRDKTLENIGIGVPALIVLSNRLRDKGFDVDETPLTVKEGRQIFKHSFSDIKIHSLSKNDDLVLDTSTVIQLKGIWYRYPSGNTALKNIDIEFHSGELVSIMGRNASGKSTLLKHLNGLLRPSRGDVTIDGQKTQKTSIAKLAETVGMVFQNPGDHLFADTVESEIAAGLHYRNWSDDEISARTSELLSQFNLERYRSQYPRYLSGGEKQRVALATALASRPKVLALDEPTRGMDHGLKKELMLFLKQYCAAGNTVILVSHDVETVAEYSDRVVLMSEGQIIVDGNRYEILSEALLFSPQINRLMQSFRVQGVPPDILTVDEVMELLK